MTMPLDDAREVRTMVDALASSHAFAWFCDRMQAQALAAISSVRVGDDDSQACMARLVQAQTLANLATTLENLGKNAERVINANTPHTPDDDEGDD